MSRTLIGAGVAALLATSAMAQQAAPPPPTPGNIPPAANATMPPIDEPFGGDVNDNNGMPVATGGTTTAAPAAPSPADTPSADMPTEGTSAPAIPTTGPDAVPERADGGQDATSLPAEATRPGCQPADGRSASATPPVEGASSGTAPGGSGSSGWTGGLGGSDIGTSQSEPLFSSSEQAPHPQVAGGLDPISGETAVSGPASPPPEEATAGEAVELAASNSPSGEDIPSAEAEIAPPAANAEHLQQPDAESTTDTSC